MSELHSQIVTSYNTAFQQWNRLRGSALDAANHVASELCTRLGVPGSWRLARIERANDEAYAKNGEIAVSYEGVARFCIEAEFLMDRYDRERACTAKIDLRMRATAVGDGSYKWKLLWVTSTASGPHNEEFDIHAPAAMDVAAKDTAKRIIEYFARKARDDAWKDR
ncbi:hypothetical protein [Polyangium spumosum]|uniref:Uncharacterized protein n=1 Tax=Polyangium spumosum TaxID=889282 RepID=A0A6N7PPS7_9BACT|nr:hypothetical protein [Polyangium spumosum]MRG94202.1 hypothetical protein [Polyangium spumosum]